MYLFVPVWKWGSRNCTTWPAKFSAKFLWLESEVVAGAQAHGSTACAFFPLLDAGSDTLYNIREVGRSGWASAT